MNAGLVMQDAFAAALLDPLQVPAGLCDRVDAAPRFAVHRNNMMAALVEALAAAFPVTLALVGEDFFGAMARDYVRAHPPRSPVVSEYGAGFADFIASHAPAAGIAYLADVARLERLRVEAFNAADADALAHARWQALTTDQERLATMRVHLHPACRWLASAHPVLSIWQAHQHAGAQRDAALASLDLQAGEEVLVHRPQWDVQQIALPAGGIDWLDALRAGAPLGTALQHACSRHPHASPDLLLALLLQHGLVVAIQPDEDDRHA
jgi:hypothetical protein